MAGREHRNFVRRVEGFRQVPPVSGFRDRDSIYGSAFRERIKVMGMGEVISEPKSPWQNPFVERLIGSIPREGTDHVIPFGERPLLGILREYVEYSNRSRTPLSLVGNSPIPRRVEHEGRIVGRAVLGRLHPRDSRAA